MILKASQRGGGKQLAIHLLNAADNEHVHVHELRGFTADDLPGAFQEAYAVSRGTKAKQFLFSLSLNPPQEHKVETETFEAAIDAIERKVGLEGQPRAVVFHEKDGRRHAHAVWSRIDAEKMRAINLPFFKMKLRDVSRELYLENGWKMPRGLVNSKERDPANYTLAEWQQAKRAGQDPKALKEMFRETWAASDSAKAFTAALRSRGYILARGERRSYVAVDYRGEVYGIARYAGIKTKEVRARIGDENELPSIDEAKAAHAERMTEMLRRHVENAEQRRKDQAASILQRRREITERQRAQRLELENAQQTRMATETRERTSRFSRGFRGLWHRVTGKHFEIKRRNEQEALLATQRDKIEKDRLAFRHIEERRPLHEQIKQLRKAHSEHVAELHCDLADFERIGSRPAPNLKENFRQADLLRGREVPDRER